MSDDGRMRIFAVQVFLRGMQGAAELSYRSQETAQKVQERIHLARSGHREETDHGAVFYPVKVDETDHFGRRLLCGGEDVMFVMALDVSRDLARQGEFAVMQAMAQVRAQQQVQSIPQVLPVPGGVIRN